MNSSDPHAKGTFLDTLSRVDVNIVKGVLSSWTSDLAQHLNSGINGFFLIISSALYYYVHEPLSLD